LLADDPQMVDGIGVLACFYPESRHSEIVTHLSKLDDKEAGYKEIMGATYDYEKAAVREMFGAMLKVDFPESELIEDYYLE